MENRIAIKKNAGELAFIITTATLLQLCYRWIGMGDFGMGIMAKVWLLGLGMAMAVYGLNRWFKLPYLGVALLLGLLVITPIWQIAGVNWVGLVVWAIALCGLIQFVMDMRSKSGDQGEISAKNNGSLEGIKKDKDKSSGIWFLGSVLVILIMGLGVNWLINYNYEFLLERGWTHIDSVWHSAISSMYKHYGICSLGIDGLHPITYHTLMHKTFAGLSVVGNIPVIQIYALFYTVWAPILLVKAMITLAKKTSEVYQKEAVVKAYQNWDVEKVGAGIWWTVAGILYMVFFRLFVFRGLNLGEEMMMSESHFMGMVFMILAFSTYLEYQKTGQFYLILLSVLWLYITSIAKSNLGVMAYAVMGMVLVLGHLKDIRFWLVYALSGAGFLASMLHVAKQASEQTAWIAPQWGFAETVKEYATLLNYLPIPVFAVKVFVHFVLFYLPVWILVWRYKRIFGQQWYKQKSMWMIAALLLPSLAVNYVVGLGFNSFYFTNPVNFFAVIFFIVPVVKWLSEAGKEKEMNGAGSNGFIQFFNRIQGSQMAMAAVLVLAVYSLLDLHRMGSKENASSYYYCRKEMVKIAPKPQMVAWVKRANELQANSNGKSVLEYDKESIKAMGYSELVGAFMVPGITEMVTVGHVPQGYFYTYGDYMDVKYPIVLPSPEERVKF